MVEKKSQKRHCDVSRRSQSLALNTRPTSIFCLCSEHIIIIIITVFHSIVQKVFFLNHDLCSKRLLNYSTPDTPQQSGPGVALSRIILSTSILISNPCRVYPAGRCWTVILYIFFFDKNAVSIIFVAAEEKNPRIRHYFALYLPEHDSIIILLHRQLWQ